MEVGQRKLGSRMQLLREGQRVTRLLETRTSSEVMECRDPGVVSVCEFHLRVGEIVLC